MDEIAELTAGRSSCLPELEIECLEVISVSALMRGRLMEGDPAIRK